MASFDVYVASSGTYLVCKVVGEIRGDDALAFSMALDKLSRETLIKHFLVDVRGARNIASPFENYNYAYKELSQSKFQRDIKSANLISPGDSSHNFVETVVNNAGYRAKFFEEEAAALAWLHETIEEPHPTNPTLDSDLEQSPE